MYGETVMPRSYKSNEVTRTWGLLAGLCLLPTYFLFDHFNDPGRGMATCIFLGVLAIVARLRWDSHNSVRQMLAIACAALIHVPLVWLIHWPIMKGPGIALLPIALPDFFFDSFIFKYVGRSESANSAP